MAYFTGTGPALSLLLTSRYKPILIWGQYHHPVLTFEDDFCSNDTLAMRSPKGG